MDYRRKPIIPTGNVTFMITDWYSYNASPSEFNYFDDAKEFKGKRFLLKLFGVTKDSKSVSVTLKGYSPYFYVMIPDNVSNTDLFKKSFLESIENRLNQVTDKFGSCTDPKQAKILELEKRTLESLKKGIKKIIIGDHYRFKWFTNKKMFRFMKIRVYNSYIFRNLIKYLEKEIEIPNFGKMKLDLYESNIDPIIKMMHDMNAKGCSWVKIPKGKYETPEESLSKTQIDIICDYKDLRVLDINTIAPIRQASFDIEANSSHGDFPLAYKDYSKPSREVLENYINLINEKKLKHKENEELLTKILYTWFVKMFEKLKGSKNEIEEVTGYHEEDISRVYTKANKKPTESTVIMLIKLIEKVLWMSEFEYFNEKVNKFKNRKTILSALNRTFKDYMLSVAGDQVIQIGTVVQDFGSKDTLIKWCGTLKGCSKIENAVIECFDSEEELILGWVNFMNELDPDVVFGYNIFGFDFEFMYIRAKELNIEDEFLNLGRNTFERAYFKKQKLASSALGENYLKMIVMDGRINIDLYKVFQGDPTNKLDSYKLDYVGEKFLGEHKDDVSPQEIFKFQKGSDDDRAIIAKYCIQDCNLVLRLLNKKKIIVNNIGMANVCLVPLSYLFLRGQGVKIYSLVANECNKENYRIPLTQPKRDSKQNTDNSEEEKLDNDDLVPVDIDGETEFVKNSDYLYIKKKYKENEKLMSKAFKKLLKESSDDPIDLEFNQGDEEPDVEGDDEEKHDSEDKNDESYEGAIVLPPEPGLYLEDPISVCDYNSLYPSSMIERNISHDSLISIRVYNEENKLVSEDGEMELELELLAGKIKNHTYIDVKYDNYKYVQGFSKNGKAKKNKDKVKDGYVICRYVQFPNDEKGILPKILMKLLKARKDTRLKAEFVTVTTKDGKEVIGLFANKSEYKAGSNTVKIKTIIFKDPKNEESIIEIQRDNVKSIEDTYDEFEKAVLDSLQLAYKVVANSLYGQVGAGTSPICWKPLAASTTATGRDRLIFAKDYIESTYQDKELNLVWDSGYYKKELFRQKNLDLSKYDVRKIHVVSSKIIYGDTDSIFVKVIINDEDGNKIKGEEAVGYSMRLLMIWAGEISSQLGKPQNIAFEKTIFPFMLIGKKQYEGIYYENVEDLSDNHRKSMGVAWKKRNYASIVSHFAQGVSDIIFTDRDIEKAKQWLQGELQKLIEGKFPIDEFIITKTLKDRIAYANPDGVAHRVLADRMGEREPGNKPQSNDRIPFCYVVVNQIDPVTNKKLDLKQGDKIEHPEFIKKNNLQLDYKFYLTNQIMNPLCSIFGLTMERPEILFKDYVELKKTKEERDAERIAKAEAKEQIKIKLKQDKTPVSLPAKKKKTIKDSETKDSETKDQGTKEKGKELIKDELQKIKESVDLTKKPTMKFKLEDIQKYAFVKGISMYNTQGKKRTKQEFIDEINKLKDK